MYIDVFKNNGTPYLRLSKSVRKTNENGEKVSTRQVIYNIGPLSRFDDGQPNYVERLRQSFREGHPLIHELEPYYRLESEGENKMSCPLVPSGDAYLYSPVLLKKMISYFIPESCFNYQNDNPEMQDSIYDCFILLVINRILNSVSNEGVFQLNAECYRPLTKNLNSDLISDTYEVIARSQDKIFKNLRTSFQDTPKLIYYCAVKTDLEFANIDNDKINKEQQYTTQVGLVMNSEGLPFAIEAYPDNGKPAAFIKSMKNKMGEFGIPKTKFILIGNYESFYDEDLHDARRYIISKNITEDELTYPEEKYFNVNPNFKYKSYSSDRWISYKEGRLPIEEKTIEYWHKEYGYNRIITSEVSMNDIEIIETYYRMKQIEEQFRIMNAFINTYISDRPDMKASGFVKSDWTISLIALNIVKRIQSMDENFRSTRPEYKDDQSIINEMPIYKIRSALNQWKVDAVSTDVYRFQGLNDVALREILEAFGYDSEFEDRLYTAEDLVDFDRMLDLSLVSEMTKMGNFYI